MFCRSRNSYWSKKSSLELDRTVFPESNFSEKFFLSQTWSKCFCSVEHSQNSFSRLKPFLVEKFFVELHRNAFLRSKLFSVEKTSWSISVETFFFSQKQSKCFVAVEIHTDRKKSSLELDRNVLPRSNLLKMFLLGHNWSKCSSSVTIGRNVLPRSNIVET